MSVSSLKPDKTARRNSENLSGALKYFIQTFGCQMNYSDTERVAAILEKSGYQKAEQLEEVDLFIFNTCSIKQKGEDRVYGIIKNIGQMKKANPRLLIGITGCMVRQTSSRNSEWDKKDDLLKNLKPLDFVFRITDTGTLPAVLAEAEPLLELSEIEDITPQSNTDYLRVKPEYTTKFQAFVPIQIGCDKYCTYCIVPYSRGREQSRPLSEILTECRQLVENGCKEITLVGQTVNSYGLSALDQKSPNFADYHGLRSQGARPELPFIRLLRELNALSELGLDRLRYTSPHPRDLTDELIEAHATFKVLCPYIHLPVQSGDNQVLARMNRKYTVEQYREKVTKLRARIPHCAISTDLIVGFSGETEEQFENTYRLFEEMQWDQAYISRYSERKGTLAHKAFPDNIPAEEKARRWHKVNNLLKKVSLKNHQALEGKVLEVLVETYLPLTKECQGKSREMKIVQFPGTPDLIGTIQKIKIEKGLDWLLKGTNPLFKNSGELA
ncbi:tRNA (N6-isopentenyl adenosine(37)-C2)-methylthiotransferase MiaB [Candidatus Peregrinibacteria bacterium]|nr:tRNA (N6-isopentenyl adenosine(37)-C2)-methylthiotransferase MiaB [Candidatus Peregrinibacteria bacterium]